ncbi:MAG: RsmB/NOP family class I SAM-dependent RNA methyltransferase [Azoarcus sp.]|jgi:16S rRNA (cytosine967-C5)-methyltransferase|nr:RsmB/NOP family class I SAM-dependent RNA methyltransferase [Azoarcus sp.]
MNKARKPDSAARAAGDVLAYAAAALDHVLEFEHPADAALSRYFREHRALGRRDRAFIAETVYAIVRRLRWLHRLSGPGAPPRRLLLAWLARGAGWAMRQFDGLVSEEERNWIEAVKALELDEGSLAERADLPDWLCERLLATYDEAGLLRLAHSLNRPAPLDLRVNILKSGRDAVLARLRGDGIAAEACPWSPHGIRLVDKPALQRHALFVDGSVEVQDEGSQLLGFLVQPKRGEMVIDFCAGAGGKTLQLGAMMRSGGRLYAFDVSGKRLAKLRPRMARAGLSNVHPMLLAHEGDSRLKRLAGKADRVLVDAPCSGLGTLRRNPDIKWRQTPAAIAEMAVRQQSILGAAAKLVRPGGRLVYATCSLLGEENDNIVDAFLAAHPEFVPQSAGDILARQGIAPETGERLRLFPFQHGTDGFFAAVLARADAPA